MHGNKVLMVFAVAAVVAVLGTIGLGMYAKAGMRQDVARAQDQLTRVQAALLLCYAERGTLPDANLHAAQGGLSGDHRRDNDDQPITPRLGSEWLSLTSPTAYVADRTALQDPFGHHDGPYPVDPLDDSLHCEGQLYYNSLDAGYIVASHGPWGLPDPGSVIGINDQVRRAREIIISDMVERLYPRAGWEPAWLSSGGEGAMHLYDPTNGLVSPGLLARAGVANATP